MRRMKYFVFMILLIFFTGCASVTNISKEKQYNSFLGSKILKGSAFICKREKVPIFKRSLPKGQLIENHGHKNCPVGKDIAMLPIGSIITIHRVQLNGLYSLFMTDHWFIVGSTIVKGQKIPFYFYYGLGYRDNGQPIEPNLPPWKL